MNVSLILRRLRGITCFSLPSFTTRTCLCLTNSRLCFRGCSGEPKSSVFSFYFRSCPALSLRPWCEGSEYRGKTLKPTEHGKGGWSQQKGAMPDGCKDGCGSGFLCRKTVCVAEPRALGGAESWPSSRKAAADQGPRARDPRGQMPLQPRRAAGTCRQ